MAGSWETLSPDGSKSTKRNVAIMNTNTVYTTTNMRLDHYWANDADKDGYHKQVSMDDMAADPTSLPTAIDSQLYVRKKTAIESPDVQLTEPYMYSTPDSGVTNYYMQMGMRCMVCFDGLTQGNIRYSHNLNSQTDSPAGVVLNGDGSYTLNFTNSMPSVNYIVTGTAMRYTTGGPLVNVGVQANTAFANSLDKDWVRLEFRRSDTDAIVQPGRAMIMICGG